MLILDPSPVQGAVTDEQFDQLRSENRELRAIVADHQRELAELRLLIAGLASNPGVPNIAATPFPVASPRAEIEPPPPVIRASEKPRVIVSGEGGLAFFAGGSDSAFPNSEFRIDDAKLYFEAEIARNTYFFSELDLTLRENGDERFRLGEIYMEFEDIGAGFGMDRLFNVRVGRVDLPFGEEYIHRGSVDNPLISHSIADIWGVDEGIALHGVAGRASYAFAVQNGGRPTIHDFDADKSVALRVGFDATSRLSLSASAMRTGDLHATKDFLSEVWFGNAMFRSIGSNATTTFSADLAQIDAAWRWRGGSVQGAIGKARYRDNDPAADNGRTFDYFQLEGLQAISRRFYGATRFSRVEVAGGYPIPGIGNFSKFFLSNRLTEKLWRLGVGIGFRAGSNVVIKLEYTFEEGRLSDGTPRGASDILATEAAVRF